MKFNAEHPLYGDETLVEQFTKDTISKGHTVLQLFQFQGGERQHSQSLLSFANIKQGAHIASFGCGVGGMEKHWKDIRPDLSFTLINASKVQLDECVCEGNKVIADIETYDGAPVDVVLIAYVLGHVDVHQVLSNALMHLNENGKIIIFDVFDSTAEFDKALFYTSPKLSTIEKFAVDNNFRIEVALEGRFPLSTFAQKEIPWVLNHTTPALFVLKLND